MKRIYLINDVLFKRSPIKKCILFLLYFVLVSAHIYAQNNENDFIASLMQKMTLEEKIGQLNLAVINNGVLTGTQISKDVNRKIKNGQVGGVFGTWNIERIKNLQDIAVKKSRLHIPLLFGLDVIHGHETIFPVPLALSCSWDTTLVKAVARTAAIEASADGINWVYSPMVDISRDARWGRNVEGAGEDPFLGAQMAKVMVEGYQGNNLMEDNTVMACVKHFALYGAVTAGREYNSVDMGKQEMYQYYFPPYKAAIDAGAGSVMSSFNDINGLPSAANKWLLTDVLRKQWGFNGFVVSDYGAINELTTRGLGDSQIIAALALNAGNDMEMVGDNYLGTLKKSIESGAVNIKTLDAACRRILEAKYKLGLFQNPYRNIDIKKAKTEEVTKGHLAQALETAKRTFVLLKNKNQLLPLKPQGTIAIIGPLADSKINMPGAWSVADDYHHSVTVLEGVKAELKDKATILYEKGANITDDSLLKLRVNSFKQEITTDKRTPRQMIDDAVKIAQKSDVIIAVVGEAADMTGESASRTNIGIPQSQLNLLKALHKTGKPLVAILFNGRPLTINWENEHCDAILDTWFGGFEAGNAIATVLFGQYNPSGKLTMSFPRNVGQVPIFYNERRTGRPFDEQKDASKYKSDYLDASNTPLFPFGYGLSYTTFSYGTIHLSKTSLKTNDTLKASIEITNTGKYAGEEVVQLYITDPVARVTRSVEDLKGFKKIFLKPGESKDVVFNITPEDLKYYDYNLKYDWDPGAFIIKIGTNSKDTKSANVIWNK